MQAFLLANRGRFQQTHVGQHKSAYLQGSLIISGDLQHINCFAVAPYSWLLRLEAADGATMRADQTCNPITTGCSRDR